MQGLFGASSMLWWGAAATIPIAIHLLSRRKYKKVPWAAMHFLERAFKRTRKRLRLENILLMILRAVILLLLAFALADPRTSGAGVLGGEQTKTVFIAIDNSFSMDYRDESNQAPFEKAITSAQGLLDGLDPEQDAAALLSLGGTSRLHVPLTRELARVGSALDQMKLTHGATDTIGGLGILAGLLEEPSLAKEYPGRKTVYIFTDMQRSALVGNDNKTGPESDAQLDAPDPRVETMLRQIKDADTDVYFVDIGNVGSERVPNVSIASLTHIGKSLVKDRPTDFECIVKNFGDDTTSGEIQFFVDSETAFAQREVVSDLKGRATGTAQSSERTIRFSATFNSAGWHYVAVRYFDDALGIDNLRRFAFEVRDRIRVLAVDGNGSVEPDKSAVFFLSRALDPWVGRRSEGVSAFDVKEVSLLDFRAENLNNYDLIVMANVAQLGAPRVDALESFVKEGGSFMYFAGRSLEVPGRLGPSGSTNSLFHKNGAGLLPFPMIKARGSDDTGSESFNLQFETFDHPAMAYFEDPKIRPGVTGLPIYKFIETKPIDKPGTRILASFRPSTKDNTTKVSWPGIVEHSFGQGKVVFISTTADTSWNILGATPAFVPLMKELAYVLTRTSNRDNIDVGSRLFVRFPTSVEAVTITIGEDAPINRKTSREEGSDTVSVAINRIDVATLVRIRPVQQENSALIPDRIVAVNVDAAESDLTRGGSGWITAHLGTELIQTIEAGGDLAVEASSQSDSRIWRALLYAVLAFLLLETLLARQFGRESRADSVAA